MVSVKCEPFFLNTYFHTGPFSDLILPSPPPPAPAPLSGLVHARIISKKKTAVHENSFLNPFLDFPIER